MQAILIVEEDESIRRILDLSLRHAGFAVGLASTNEEALRRLADGPDSGHRRRHRRRGVGVLSEGQTDR